jgi:dTDP-glucose 4,6-dehydratase
LDFAKEILEMTQSKQRIIFKDLPINDPLQRCPNIDRAKNILDWTPKINRSEGLMKTYKYFKDFSSSDLIKEEHKDFSKYIY